MMNGRLNCVLTALALTICLTAALQAQGTFQAVRVSVPFAFEARDHSLPAGEYQIEYRQANAMLVITPPAGDRQAVLTMPIGNPNDPKSPRLVFERMGNVYRLAEVWVGGAATGAGIPATRSQMLIARTQTPQRVEIALVRK